MEVNERFARVATATGKTLIREEFVRDFSLGLRQPSQSSLKARRDRAEKMRTVYQMTHKDVV